MERYLRTFIYDRVNDLVLVYDSITKTDPTFTSRWLIHFPDKPAVLGPDRFLLAPRAEDITADPGGILEGRVLLPVRAQITPVGGPGKEFWVDGENYDDQGAVQKAALRGKRMTPAEAGTWRIEITPATLAETDEYLVAMPLKRTWSDPTPSVSCTQGNGVISCAITGKRDRILQIAADGTATLQ